MAEVNMTPEASSQFDALPRAIRTRVLALYERLRKWPEVSGAKPLRGDLAGSYRLRTGDYRVQFRIAGDLVIVDKVGHRARFYEE